MENTPDANEKRKPMAGKRKPAERRAGKSSSNRRNFLKNAGIAAAGAFMAKPASALTISPNLAAQWLELVTLGDDSGIIYSDGSGGDSGGGGNGGGGSGSNTTSDCLCNEAWYGWGYHLYAEAEEQYQTNWCGLGVGMGIVDYYYYLYGNCYDAYWISMGQCALYKFMMIDIASDYCCQFAFRDPNIPSSCNDSQGPGIGPVIARTAHDNGGVDGQPGIDSIVSQIDQTQPIAIRVLWINTNPPVYHALMISGYYCAGDGTGFIDISDPWNGDDPGVEYCNFQQSYGATWLNTFFTGPSRNTSYPC